MSELEHDEAFRCGTPSAEECTGHCKSSPTDPEVTDDEYDRVWEVLQTRLSALGYTAPGTETDYYFRGDNFGDRTQYLEIVDPNKLTLTLISELRGWLREQSFCQWRIAVITYLGNAGTLMIYPQAVRLGRAYGDDLKQALARIVAIMRQTDTDEK